MSLLALLAATAGGGTVTPLPPTQPPMTYLASVTETPAAGVAAAWVDLADRYALTWAGATRTAWDNAAITTLGRADASTIMELELRGFGVWSMETMHTGTQVALTAPVAPGAAASIRAYVDGNPVTWDSDAHTSPTGAWAYRLSWATTGTRRIRWEVRGYDPTGVDHDGTLAAPPATTPIRIAMIGDSYVAGSFGTRSYPWQVARHLGGDAGNVALATFGLGGTGYVNGDATSRHYGAAARMAAVAKYDPDLVILFGSQNDADAGDLASTNYSTFVGYVNAILTALAPTPVYVVGPSPYGTAPTDTTMQSLAAAHSNVIGYSSIIGEAWLPKPAAGDSGTMTAITDLTTTTGSTTVTSPSGLLALNHMSRPLVSTRLPAGTTIARVISPTVAVVSAAATSTGTDATAAVTYAGDNAYYRLAHPSWLGIEEYAQRTAQAVANAWATP